MATRTGALRSRSRGLGLGSVAGHRGGTSSLLAGDARAGALVLQGFRRARLSSGAGMLIRKLRVRVPPPEPMDGRKPLCSNGFRPLDSVDQSAISTRFILCSSGIGTGTAQVRARDFATRS